MLKVFRHLVVWTVMTILGALGGRSCSTITIHPTAEAAYMASELCVINTDIPHDKFIRMTEWCIDLHK